MKKRKGYFTACAVIALSVFAALSTFGLAVVGSTAKQRKNDLDALYSRAFYDVCDGVNNLEVSLSKLIVGSGGKTDLATIGEVAAFAEGCEASFSSLPLSYHDTEDASKYFNQVADWARSSATVVSEGGKVSGFSEQAESLYIVARSMNEGLRTIAFSMGERCVGDCIGEGRTLVTDFAGGFSQMQTNGIEYPEVIYDGPFSDAKKHCWTALEGMAEIDEATAVEKVKSLLGADEAYLVGTTHGKADAYEIEGKCGGEEIYALVSKKGGLIISYDRAREVAGVTLSEQSAVRLAEEKISGLGYEGLSPVWYNAGSGIAMVTLAPKADGVTYYPDLVKVKLSLDDGTLLGVEAAGYCASHRSRSYVPSVDEGTVRALLSDKLSVESISLAVIPSACGEKEYFCYEAVGEYKGLRYYAYLDAVTGEQRQILRVVETEQGEMVV